MQWTRESIYDFGVGEVQKCVDEFGVRLVLLHVEAEFGDVAVAFVAVEVVKASVFVAFESFARFFFVFYSDSDVPFGVCATANYFAGLGVGCFLKRDCQWKVMTMWFYLRSGTNL